MLLDLLIKEILGLLMSLRNDHQSDGVGWGGVDFY